MNLPAINIKMKNQNNQFKQDPSSGMDGFGLGIQVFKIESVKNMDSNFKSKNRTAIKNIENPIQPINNKPPLMPKPKKLPSLQKSHSEINSKQRLSGFVLSKIQTGSHHGYTDKIIERKQANIDQNRIVTPVSYSMRKKVGVSTQKNITTHHSASQTAKPFHIKNVPQDKQKVGNKVTTGKLNQTAPPETMYKPQQLYYKSYSSEHEVLNNFYSEFQNCQKQNIKEIKQLRKLKQNQFDPEICDRIEYLQSLQGKIQNVIDSIDRQQFQQKNKEIAKMDEKRHRKMFNSIVPVRGFQFSEMEMFEYDSIGQYQLGDYKGAFKVSNYENVDFAPMSVQPKNEDE